ncbi:MAG: hypothetical protein LUD76_01155 [Alistipes sp.]|nr:hypothetical protein [Alistipes sp.]
MRTIHYIITAMAAAVMLPGCVKDAIYNTDHLFQGKVVTVTADWSDRGAGVEKPASYKIIAAGLDATATADTWALNKLFDPGNYTFRAYNTPEGITVSGAVASVNTVQAPTGQTGSYIDPLPGWLMSGKATETFEKDTKYDITIRATQIVRQLTLVIEPEGSAADDISAITATLSGVAAAWDMDTDTPQGDPANVALTFIKQTSGEYAVKWTATVRLLGVTGAAQRLTGEVSVAGQPDTAPLLSDLTAALNGFNTDKKTPFAIKTAVTVEPEPGPYPEIPPGFTATIKDWERIIGGTGIAN